ncbi:CDP-diacylglycerol--glycerol-3-phosphate 3-phosphatidyltransferase [Coemansia sp. RSA 1939]|nr:CDP-diacylglycerol--glycerol-3-phosphate 3-phosphatidyltransferase [Coemansia sp. RSA 1939]KAJ2609217.1 CDP-diacylglycerol--glycerol-3-phosphate 3-phosphatidyltransferase [Coemansia sp. RSA 1804]KAJ2688090.1 CDP-diacylglycerol--glycerol-3-phosphate 3-phosphatidyltransferase [Coemansia sp. RSA 1285]
MSRLLTRRACFGPPFIAEFRAPAPLCACRLLCYRLGGPASLRLKSQQVHGRAYSVASQSLAGPAALSAHQVFSPLTKERPVFRIQNRVVVIREPGDFYREILQGIQRARKRIVLSSLYIGSEETELADQLARALERNPDLEVLVLLDCLRGTRIDGAGKSSALLLAPLVKKHANVHVALYHTPALSGLNKTAWPQRYNETFGLQHIKAYLFDDDVIISGANLSRDYFTNRQDRYMLFSDRSLADYFAGLVQSIARFSFQLVDKSASTHPLRDGDASSDMGLRLPNNTPDPARNPADFVRDANAAMAQFLQSAQVLHAVDPATLTEHDTLVIPTVQMRQLGITQDEAHMTEFFSLSDSFARRYGCRSMMASAYFNFSPIYKKLVLESSSRWDLLVASPEANGFHTAAGVSKYIPDMYSIIEHDFMRYSRKHYARNDIAIEEYARPGWTYHGKGVWCYLDRKLPQVTMVGSSNYGYRSIYCDLEAQITLIPGNKDLQTDIHQEVLYLLSHSKMVTETELKSRIRSAPLWLYALKPFISKKM